MLIKKLACTYISLAYLFNTDTFIVCALTCRAPELFEVPSNCEIDEKTDVWSLGCTLYAMAYGEYVADGKSQMCNMPGLLLQ